MADKVEVVITAKDDASGVIHGITGALGRMMEVAGGFIVADIFGSLAAGVRRFADELVGLGKESILAAARVDELRVVNQVLAKNAGISGDAVAEEAKEVRRMGIEAAVAERIVAEFVRSNLELAKASDVARIAQDAAVISGMNSSEAAERIIEGIVKLNPIILRNAGIIADLDLAYRQYAAALGKSVQDLTPFEKQQAALNAVLEQGAIIAGAYEAAMEKPGKVIRSFPRYINDILVAMGEPFQNAFSVSVMAVAELAKSMGKAVSEGGAFRPVLEAIADKAGAVAAKFAEVIRSIADFVASKKPLDVIRGLDEVPIIGRLAGIADALMPMLALLSGVGGAVRMILLPVIGQLADNLAPLASEVLPIIGSTLAEISASLASRLLPPLVMLVGELLPPLAGLFVSVASALLPLVEELLPPLVELIISLGAALMPVVQEFLTALMVILTQLAADLRPLISEIVPILIMMISELTAAFVPLLQVSMPILISLLRLITTLLVALGHVVIPIVTVAVAVWTGAVTGLINTLTPFWRLVTVLIVPALNSLTSWIRDRVAGAVAGLSDRIASLTDTFQRVSSVIRNVVDWFGRLREIIAKTVLPHWLTPGSPTPFELGLRGIGDAVRDLAHTKMPQFQASLQAVTAGTVPVAHAAASAGVTVVLQYSPILSTVDEDELNNVLLPFIRRGVREVIW